MSQDVLFDPPTTAGDLKPGARIKHGGKIVEVTGYRFPSGTLDIFVLLEDENGDEFELPEDAVVEVIA